MKKTIFRRTLFLAIAAIILTGAGSVQSLSAEGLYNMTDSAKTETSGNAGAAKSIVPPASEDPFQHQFTGVGPVVSGSVDYKALPGKARKFLEKYCDGHAIVKCEKKFTSGEYDITLADGIEFVFDPKGNVIDTEAPEGYSLSLPLLKAIVPGKLYNLLIHNGFQNSVEGVHRNRSGCTIDVSDPVFKAVTFEPSGVLTLVVNE